jgi:hypothetical protein
MHQELIESISKNLSLHRQTCEELLELMERENQSLRTEKEFAHGESARIRKKVLALLAVSLERIKADRGKWLKLDRSFKAGYPEIVDLLRQTQDVIARVMLYDRENEQLLLRKGLVPATHIPSLNRQRPNYVAGLYRQHAPG